MMRLLLGVVVGCGFLLAADARVKVDNDIVRILNVVDMPHNKSALHQHDLNRVMVYLDDGDMELTYEDGHKDKQHWKAGQAAWSPAGGRHISENVGSAPLRIIELELKKPAPTAAPVRRRELDPLVIDRKHNTLLFENGQVRVFRSWREPGGTEPMHEHAGTGRAAVLLTDLDASVKFADGTSKAQRGSAGDVLWWSGTVSHSTTNVGPKQFVLVAVEVK